MLAAYLAGARCQCPAARQPAGALCSGLFAGAALVSTGTVYTDFQGLMCGRFSVQRYNTGYKLFSLFFSCDPFYFLPAMSPALVGGRLCAGKIARLEAGRRMDRMAISRVFVTFAAPGLWRPLAAPSGLWPLLAQ